MRIQKGMMGLLLSVALVATGCAEDTTSDEVVLPGVEAPEGGETPFEEGGEAGTEEGGEAGTEEGGETAEEGGETAEEGGETPVQESCFSKLADLKAGPEGEVEAELCGLTVNYVQVYTNTVGDEEVMTSFSVYVSAMDEETGNYTASQLYVTPVTTTDENGDEVEEFPFAVPAIGDVVSVTALEYGNYQGTQDITPAGDLTVTGTGEAVVVALTDLGAPSEETENMVVAGEMTIVSGPANEFGEIVGKTLVVDYGAGDVQLYGGSELEDFLAVNPVCAGGTLTLTAGIITQYEDVHQIRVFDAANEVTVSGGTCATYDDSNWGFEDWTTSNPPAGFISLSTDFTATESTLANSGDYGCELTWTSKSNQDFIQGYFSPVTGTNATFSFWVNDADENGRLRPAITFYDADGNSLGNEFSNTYSDDITENTEGWNEMVHSIAVPAEAATARAWVRMYDVKVGDEWVGSATVTIDDWSLTFAD